MKNQREEIRMKELERRNQNEIIREKELERRIREKKLE